MKKRQDEYLNKVKRLEAEDRKRKAVAQSAWGLGSFMGMGGMGGSPGMGGAVRGSFDDGEVVDGRPRDEQPGPPQRQLMRRERESKNNTTYDSGDWSDAAQDDNQEGYVGLPPPSHQPFYEGQQGRCRTGSSCMQVRSCRYGAHCGPTHAHRTGALRDERVCVSGDGSWMGVSVEPRVTPGVRGRGRACSMASWWKMRGKGKNKVPDGDRSVYEYNYDDYEDDWEETPLPRRRVRCASLPPHPPVPTHPPTRRHRLERG